MSSGSKLRHGDKSAQLRVQDIVTHLAEYYAETNPIEQLIYERAFISWFRVHAAYKRAVKWDSPAECDILIDALMTVAKRDDWSASVLLQNQKFLAGGPHAIRDAAREVRDRWGADVCANRRTLLDLANALQGLPVVQAREPITLDALFKQVRDAETYFREQARRPHSPTGLSR